MKTSLITIPAIALAIISAPALRASNGTWAANSGNWSDSGNWVSGTIADGVGAVANLNNNISAQSTVTIDTTTRTVGILNWGDTDGSHRMSLTGSGGGQLIFDNGASPAEWNIGPNNLGGMPGFNAGLNIDSVRVASDVLNINNQSSGPANAAWAGFFKADSAGTKTITNVSTGTAVVAIGYNLGSGAGSASGSIADGDGVLRFRQNSATSEMQMLATPGGSSMTFTGGFIWDQGNVLAWGTNAFGAASGPVAFNANGGVLRSIALGGSIGNTAITLNADITVDVTATSNTKLSLSPTTGLITMTGNRVLTVYSNGGVANASNSHVSMGPITDGGNGYSFTKEGDGVLLYSGTGVTLNYTGGTFINGGRLQMSGAAFLNANGPVTINNGAQWGLNDWQTVTEFTLNSGSTFGNGTIFAQEFFVSQGTFDTIINQRTGFTAPLTKSGSGTVTILKTASYQGATTVNAGTLVVAATGSLHNNSAITVAAGAELRYNSSSARTGPLTLNGDGASRAILSGTGAINLALTLNNIGDTLSPGNSPGLMPFGTNQSWNSFTYLWETNNFTGTTAGTHFDQINITGSLTLTGGIGSYAIDITSLTAGNTPGDVPNFSEVDTSWTILTTTTGITGFNPAHWTLLDTNFTSDPAWTGFWSVDQDGNNLVLTYTIPEPASWLLLGLGLSAILLRRRIRP